MNPRSERRSSHTPLRHRLCNQISPLVLAREHHRRATRMLDRLLHPIQVPALSSQRGWWPRNNSLLSTNANTAERDSLAPAALRSTFTATQASVRSNVPLKDATARLVCRATCAATHAHICSRETRVARAKAKKRARRVLRSHRPRNRSSRRHLLDEPRLRPANPAERGDHHDDTSLLYSARSLSGLECFDYGIIMFLFSSCNAQHGKLIYGIRHSDCHICIAIYLVNLFACHPRVSGGKPVR